MLGRLTSRNIGVDGYGVAGAIHRRHLYVKVGKWERLPLQIIWRNRREEGYVHANHTSNRHCEHASRRGVLEGSLGDRIRARLSHPCEDVSIDADHTSPRRDLVAIIPVSQEQQALSWVLLTPRTGAIDPPDILRCLHHSHSLAMCSNMATLPREELLGVGPA